MSSTQPTTHSPVRFTAILLAVAIVCMATVVQAAQLLSSDVFVSGTDGYAGYRIPAIEATPNGTLVAFAEARKHGFSDPGYGKQDIDLVCKTSSDGGKTWSKMIIMEDPGELWSAANPCTLVDRKRSRVWVIYIRSEPRRSSATSRPKTRDMMTFARYSDDNAKTWSDPIDLTAVARDMDDPKWRVSVPGPGGGIQTRSGILMVPIWGSTTDRGPDRNLAIFSSDHGKTWQRGKLAPLPNGGDENQLVELADGAILMDIRQNKQNKGHRLLTISRDDGKTWEKSYPGTNVSPVACAIERYSLAADGDDRNRILWTGPKGPGRKHLVMRISYDEGKTFTDERSIAKGKAAYSDMSILKDCSVGVLWERAGYKFITFTRLDREFVEAAAKP
ncbi:MAG: sialidase family protein [Planctomycetota bacterium]|nr:sialidase family protein [Planctomycetota bacterium]